MSFTINDKKQYTVSASTAYQTALAAIEGLEGKILKQKPETGAIEVQFNKTVLGKVLGDRTKMQVAISAPDENSSVVAVEVYPLNAVGQKLMFGARQGVSRTVANWFYAHLEHRLPK